MSDILTTGNKRDKWILRATDLINWLYNHKSAVLVEGDNITLTPQEDGTIEISASGGGEGTVTDVLVDGVSVVNQDGEAEIDLSDKQDKLVAGTNIQIGQDGKTISATDTTYSDFVGATSQQAGTHGLVPAPLVTEKGKFLKGDGTWGEAGGGNVDDVVMNGQSIVDTNKVASFNNYVELTQSEYDALPASKLTDGILYCIKDTGIVEGEKFAPVIYSLEEREVGVWTDGKPLYQKSFNFDFSSTVSNWTLFDDTVSYDSLVGAIVKLVFSNNSDQVMSYPDRDTSPRFCIKTDNKLYYYTLVVSVGIVTLQYTKTTDIPGSGTWGTDGVPMVHYDGNEKIIGTWFGETLYEKTVILDTISKNTWVDVGLASLGINSVHEIIVVKGRYHTPSSTWSVDANFYNSSSSFGTLGASWNVNTPRISYYYADSSANNTQLYITIQYTKTSS